LAEVHRADLIVLGADGLGAVGDGMLGGTTSRVLVNAPCDVLVTRRAMDGGPILTGVDGSEEALRAAAQAVALGRAMNRPIHVAAVYDPQFHTRVFVTMARSLSAERQEQVGLANQEKLHDDIINDGLGKLYAEFLREAEHRFGGDGAVVKTALTTGKAYCALDLQARQLDADLIVLGRYGHHRESCSRIGSNAENFLRTTAANVLLVGGVAEHVGCAVHTDRGLQTQNVVFEDPATPDAMEMVCTAHPTDTAHAANHQSSIIDHQLIWSSDAEARLQRVPSFVRSMAKRAVENAVRESGKDRVSVDDFNDVAARFGMGPGGNA
jgi:nucleotide-binding universal stress UspA family protein